MMSDDLFDGGPLDGTELARVIAETVPEANRRVRMDEWRADLKRRVAARLADRTEDE